MTLQFTAVFENGVLRPTQSLSLPEGAEVRVILLSPPPPPLAGPKTPAEILAEIATLPPEGTGDPFTSRDHDRALYGEGRTP
jgi:predicted DNA-binding antitoxin AbrB/MazE fold protein